MLRLSKEERAIGSIKQAPEDFRVEEITSNGTILKLDTQYSPAQLGMQEVPEGKFTLFVLQKTNWNTAHALKMVAKSTNRGIN